MSTAPSSSYTIYEILTTFLGVNSATVLELEVLPSSYPLPPNSVSPILQDGTSLAIPKKALIQAFLIAREILSTFLKHPPQPDRRNYTEGTEKVERATKVILLYDPEHLTATNWRKRYLQARINSVADSLSSDRDTKSQHLKQELAFLSSLLRSHLHRHAKSPTLWHHRLWLLKTYHSHLITGHATGDPLSTAGFLASEIDTVMAAASRHKANYYAWQYGRRLLVFLEHQMEHQGGGNGPAQPYTGLVDENMVRKIHKWCLANPRDISGWAFLDFLLRRAEGDEDAASGSTCDGKTEALSGESWTAKAIRETEKFVKKIGWKGESVEWFLKNAKQTDRGLV
ncbi:hypothetical protein MMC24_007866 [Lignoscripta atroalba]|nr:hypothetical protein [Lignoscripta atroalba]